MAKPIILYDVIDSDSAKKITENIIEHPENEPLEIWMNSPGGSVSAGWSILAALQKNRGKKNITVMGDASSFAFFMLLFSDKNIAYDTSNFLIHRAASFLEELMNDDELKDIEERNNILRSKLENRIDQQKFISVTGKTFDEIFSMENRIDVRLNAMQAKEIGLIDEVIKLDVKKRKDLDLKYFMDIAALAGSENQVNINLKNEKMGKLTDLIFGEKEPVLIAKIGDSQFVYSKLEAGAKVKAIGSDVKAISGTFESENKQITVVENEITAVKDLDLNAKKIETLEASIAEMKKNQVTAEDIKEVFEKFAEKQNAEISAIKDALASAKLSVSKPKLPEGEFVNEPVKDSMTVAERIIAAQQKKYEENLKNRGI